MRLRAAAPSPLRLIHRDFHGDNILVAGGRLALLDFEDCAMGEPADDVGSNWAQLTWHVHKAGARNAGPAAGRQAFLDGISRHGRHGDGPAASRHTPRCTASCTRTSAFGIRRMPHATKMRA